MSEGLDFLGFRIQWRRKRGTSKWYIYTFIGDRPIRSLIQLNRIMRGWANYFKHAVSRTSSVSWRTSPGTG